MPESSQIAVRINGVATQVESGSTVAAALLNSGTTCRKSESGEPRTALCGMGICFECRATVNGRAHRRTCQLLCHDGMVVETER